MANNTFQIYLLFIELLSFFDHKQICIYCLMQSIDFFEEIYKFNVGSVPSKSSLLFDEIVSFRLLRYFLFIGEIIKMSWQTYIDNLMGTKHMVACGIFGLDGSTWAASPGFPVSFNF